ncbi:MAG: type III-B CRISPR module-associated protein Cmr5 [Phototrophicales bacterium]|nr:MAG: type III-B CRISPR module-associated protein Cmr5 [Phototrophicales bacterium]
MTQKTGQSQRQTTEQIRAVQAWDAITEIEREYPSVTGKYGTLARGLPAMIQTNGLAVTAAFLASKPLGEKEKNREHERVLTHLGARLHFVLGSGSDLMAFIRTASTDQYRRATAELITYATWLKRYAEAKGWKSSEGE